MYEKINSCSIIAWLSFIFCSQCTRYLFLHERWQAHSASQVPAPVMQSFNERYPGATNVRWEVEREDGGKVYQAEFNYNGKHLKAQFAPDGTFLGQRRA